MKKNHVLLFKYNDQPAVISGVSQFLAHHKANIIQIEHHRECIQGGYKVFVRLEWENGQLNDLVFKDYFAKIAQQFGIEYTYFPADYKMKMAIFVSKMNHCSNDLLHRHSIGELDCDISLIISNHNTWEQEAKMYNVPFYCLNVTAENKKEAEAKQIQLLKQYEVDFCVLARYMQILSPEFTQEYSQRIINIHHSFLPAFEGANPYKRAFEKGVKLIGATSHYVTQDLDEGPIIEQRTAQVSNKHCVEDFVRIGRDTERLVLSKAVRYHLEHRIIVHGNKTIIFDN